MECQIRDVKVFYEEHGVGRPLLMLHGWGLDHRHMRSEMEPVFRGRRGWRRIYVDLPGCGRTPGAAWIHGQDQILELVLAFVEQVIPQTRFAVAGMSAGGLLARGVAYHLGERMDGLLLLVPVVVAEDVKRERPAAMTLVSDDALLTELDSDDGDMLRGALVQSRSFLQALHRDYLPAQKMADQEFLQPIRQDTARYGLPFEVDDLKEPFPAPALILLGRQDAGVGYRDQLRLTENYPRGTFVIVDRAGHLLAVDQEALFRALVGEWLDRVEEYAAQM
jgi:pimeloyl-ACP methyl ester carboxylesterase